MDEQIKPALIPIDDWRTFRIEEESGKVKLSLQVTGDGGMMFRIEPPDAHALIEALEMLPCMQDTSTERWPPQDIQTYRKWFLWTAQVNDRWYPQVDNPDVLDEPVTLPICPSKAAAVAACQAWIDKQYVSEDDPSRACDGVEERTS